MSPHLDLEEISLDYLTFHLLTTYSGVDFSW